jgi:uncharacterized protein YxeA
MNDFKKGLLVGMLVMIGCMFFIASNSNNDVGRYLVRKDFEHYLIDTKTGDFYMMMTDNRWRKISSFNPNDK